MISPALRSPLLQALHVPECQSGRWKVTSFQHGSVVPGVTCSLSIRQFLLCLELAASNQRMWGSISSQRQPDTFSTRDASRFTKDIPEPKALLLSPGLCFSSPRVLQGLGGGTAAASEAKAAAGPGRALVQDGDTACPH